jgi:glutamate-5-semialdehyde dehydrogenase
MGVVGMIYEARPNVTVDSFGLCFKAGNSSILRGGSEALHSNMALVEVLQSTLEKAGHPRNVVQLISDPSRELARQFMGLNQYVDVLIPRGGAGLIKSTVENSTIPVIETGVGNCHIFVDASAGLERAVDIIINAKTQRPSVCNACEKLLIHRKIEDTFVPVICKALAESGVEIRGDEAVRGLFPAAKPAAEEDWYTEYLDLIIGVKVVEGFDEAVSHISRYSSGHTEAILTESYANAQRFAAEVDSAAVFVNASTRFTDGEEFGLGAEIGISTQKLHARGPMGLKALTTTKFVAFGNGQIRA